jgi:hypothetical protein
MHWVISAPERSIPERFASLKSDCARRALGSFCPASAAPLRLHV